ncbi:MAG: 50S ribosomal protein L10 [Chloroflexi bacterium]|nr:MAG: 50S ribosomal protein L10 [Chloroflexota bacterium]
MPTQKKIETVADLKERIERATLLASADYRGLRVKEMVEMRRRLREAGLEVRVVKNTLLRLATNESGQPELLEIVEGPTALAMGYGDVIEAAKALAGYAQGAPAGFGLRGGFMDGRVLSAQDLRDLVRVPPKPVLLAQFMGQIQSPLAGFVGLMEGPLRELTLLVQSLLSELPGLVEARARQMEAAGIGVEEPVVEEPAAKESSADEPPGEAPATEKAAAEEPAAQEPAAEEPPVEEPATEEAATEEPAAEEPAVEEAPEAEQQVEEEPITEEPGAEEPETAKEENNG